MSVRDPILIALIDKLPSFDGGWTPEFREAWWRCFNTALSFIGPAPEPSPPRPAAPSVYDWFLPERRP